MLYGRGQGGKPIRPMPIKPGGRVPFPAHWGAPPRIQTKDLRPLPGGYGTGSSTLAGWIRMNTERTLRKNVRNRARNLMPAILRGASCGRLLVGMEKGHTQEQCQKVLAGAIPDLKVTKGMFNNTILVISLPNTINEEQAIAALKKVQGVKYAELDGVVSIQSGAKPEWSRPGIKFNRAFSARLRSGRLTIQSGFGLGFGDFRFLAISSALGRLCKTSRGISISASAASLVRHLVRSPRALSELRSLENRLRERWLRSRSIWYTSPPSRAEISIFIFCGSVRHRSPHRR